ncbi:hypothetical protein [Paracoccus beibuensis]|uniref:hypothetical protein n=1 Tax=Paracoccus beibuensis TaxID=547602 RepID=UPI00223E8FEC|nr:hypothetical protein [Paracoccus beibuensis]
MSRALLRQTDQIKASLLCGNAAGALTQIDEWLRIAGRKGLDPAAKERLEPVVTELRALAQASLDGALQAADQVRAIIEAARSLQTYDSLGRRLVTATRANAPQRF